MQTGNSRNFTPVRGSANIGSEELGLQGIKTLNRQILRALGDRVRKAKSSWLNIHTENRQGRPE